MLPNNATLGHKSNLKQQTEKALKAINQYEKYKQISIVNTSYSLPTETSFVFTEGGSAIRLFEPKQIVKMQLLSNCIAYYQIFVSQKVQPQIVIKNFKGGLVQIFIFYDRILKDLDKATHHFFIRDQIILKLPKKHFDQAKSIYFVFKTTKQIGLFTFRMDMIKQKKKKGQIKTDKSLQAIQLEDITKNKQQLVRSQSSKKRSQSYKTMILNPMQLLRMRPEQKIKRLNELKNLQLEKQEAAKKRIENIQIQKQKNGQAQKMLTICKKLFQTYKDLVNKQHQKQIEIIRDISPLFYLFKFCLISSMFVNQRQKKMKSVLMVRNYQKKFIKKIRKAYFQTKRMQPIMPVRQLQVPFKVFYLIGNSVSIISIKKAANIIYQTFSVCFPRFLINLSMKQASNYRRIVRVVQKRWRGKFQARNILLMRYMQKQLKTILQNYPQLYAVQKYYRQKNRVHHICLQYQKQTAGKLVGQIQAYKSKLEQIEQYIKINKQIEQENKTALKKNQKQLLEVPSRPSFPQFRFFRDVLFLKSMIRGQLQVQFRKYKKKNPHLFVQKIEEKSPRKIKKNK